MTCMPNFWWGALIYSGIITLIAAFFYFFRRMLVEDGKKESIDFFFYPKMPIFGVKKIRVKYLLVPLLLVVWVWYFAIDQAWEYKASDILSKSYTRISNKVNDLNERHCIEGKFEQTISSDMGEASSRIYVIEFEDRDEFLNAKSDENRYCFKSVRFHTAINDGLKRVLGTMENAELKICWVRNVDSDFGSDRPHSGKCIYKVEARRSRGQGA